jgi:heme exporter protein A
MILEVKNLSYTRSSSRDNYLFRKLNFKLSAGQLMVIQGNNGAGKSTLLKVVAGLIAPEKGGVYWKGDPISKSTTYRSNMSYLSHKDGLRQALTLHENLILDIKLNTQAICNTQLTDVLNAFRLQECKQVFCQNLSAGQRRKLRLASIILKQSLLWILDEPFTFLDKQSSEVLRMYFRSHLTQGGMILMASHHTEEQESHQIIDLSSKASSC